MQFRCLLFGEDRAFIVPDCGCRLLTFVAESEPVSMVVKLELGDSKRKAKKKSREGSGLDFPGMVGFSEKKRRKHSLKGAGAAHMDDDAVLESPSSQPSSTGRGMEGEPKGNAPAAPLRGMKKWIAEYRAKRPGLHVLQEQIDDFMAEFDAREEQAKRDREAAAAEDGWTVVVNKGGRKKNTDESGISVGAVDVTAATERAKKKQRKEGILDFYRFQRREARRNEVLELQQKFEEDKKRIAKMKAARKFRPF